MRCLVEAGVDEVEDGPSDVKFEVGDGVVVEVEFALRGRVGAVAEPELVGAGVGRDRTGAM